MSRARSLSLLGNENTLAVDQTNSYVGVGTTIPSSQFQVGLGLTMDGPSGVITATKFVGDGSGIRDVSVGGASSIAFDDSVGAYWGADEDLQIIHDTSHSRIAEQGTGSLIISGSTLSLQNQAKNETLAEFAENAAADLYYDNTKRIETTNTGAVVTGILTATTNAKVGDYIALDHAATGGTVTATHFSGNITGTAATFTTVSVAGTITHEDVTNVDSVGIVTGGLGVRVLSGGIQAVGFYTGFNAAGVATFASTLDADGWVSCADTVALGDNKAIYFGADEDFKIYHDGSEGFITNTTGN